MGTDKILFIIAVGLYGLATIYAIRLWKSGFRERFFPWGIFLLLGFGCHIGAMVSRGFSLQACPIHNLFEVGMFIGWTLGLGAVVSLFWKRIRFVAALLLPLLVLLGLFTLIPGFDRPRLSPLPQWVSLHATFAFLAYGAWGIAATCSLMYLIQERNLKMKNVSALLRVSPSVKSLETVTVKMLIAGFLFLTVGLAVGLIGYHHETGSWLARDAKILWAFALWFCLMELIFAHYAKWLYGRRQARWVLFTFIFVLLTLWPTSYLSNIHGTDGGAPDIPQIEEGGLLV